MELKAPQRILILSNIVRIVRNKGSAYLRKKKCFVKKQERNAEIMDVQTVPS